MSMTINVEPSKVVGVLTLALEEHKREFQEEVNLEIKKLANKLYNSTGFLGWRVFTGMTYTWDEAHKLAKEKVMNADCGIPAKSAEAFIKRHLSHKYRVVSREIVVTDTVVVE